ncbi:MAG: ergothioneine biosynthesis protein EgtB [Candidatus Endobugula sp.]|jgi:ergothioneine biosynthesis protein EgtB
MLLAQFQHTRQHTEKLCRPLCTEDYIPQAVDFTSPPKWHLAHTSWFFEEMILKQYMDAYSVFDESFNFLFNSYYQGIGERAIRGQRGIISRPTVDQVYQYRQHVDQHMVSLLSTLTGPELANIQQLTLLGINHEQQHQELLITDLKYTFSLNPTYPIYQVDDRYTNNKNIDTGWVNIDEGLYSIGHEGNGFVFDNELGRHKVYLPSYSINQALVTNGEYIKFIRDGGYKTFQFWLDEGWSWVSDNQIGHPLYWQEKGGQWYHYTLAGLKLINPDDILLHVSYYEANAFANWKQQRLPTEFEWEVASQQLRWGQCWEWTSSAYQPYPNFAVNDGAVGEYNGKFMINQIVLRGASNATAEGHSRRTYRNFFHPHFQWQFSGIRLVKNN